MMVDLGSCSWTKGRIVILVGGMSVALPPIFCFKYILVTSRCPARVAGRCRIILNQLKKRLL
ncbi:hypothetical protein HanRHA438_Chr17g0832721 [Helianthus annuus]|nr:hypothetical protein HanRHA438_Chr17g0832721 [Helianthus annuus]